MPNWCANRLRVSGPEYHVKNALALIESGEGVPLYARAAAEGIQLFLAGCAGLLRPVEATDYAPYPALVKGTGSDTPQNRAFRPNGSEVAKCDIYAQTNPGHCGDPSWSAKSEARIMVVTLLFS